MIRVFKEPKGSPKKFRAVLPDGKVVRFGARGYSDFTIHKDPERMKRYIKRHGGAVNKRDMLKVTKSSKENWSATGVRTPGFWSRWLLWSFPSLDKAAQHTSRVLGYPVVLQK